MKKRGLRSVVSYFVEMMSTKDGLHNFCNGNSRQFAVAALRMFDICKFQRLATTYQRPVLPPKSNFQITDYKLQTQHSSTSINIQNSLRSQPSVTSVIPKASHKDIPKKTTPVSIPKTVRPITLDNLPQSSFNNTSLSSPDCISSSPKKMKKVDKINPAVKPSTPNSSTEKTFAHRKLNFSNIETPKSKQSKMNVQMPSVQNVPMQNKIVCAQSISLHRPWDTKKQMLVKNDTDCLQSSSFHRT